MLHVGWASADSTVTSARSAADRAATGGDYEPGHLTVGVGRRTQALVECAVFAVDGHEFGAGGRPQGLHDRPGGDQALLVRQSQALAGPERPDRHREAGEPDHAVDDDVGWLDD